MSQVVSAWVWQERQCRMRWRYLWMATRLHFQEALPESCSVDCFAVRSPPRFESGWMVALMVSLVVPLGLEARLEVLLRRSGKCPWQAGAVTVA